MTPQAKKHLLNKLLEEAREVIRFDVALLKAGVDDPDHHRFLVTELLIYMNMCNRINIRKIQLSK